MGFHDPQQNTTKERARALRAIIDAEGGCYILPHQNKQPNPALAIASIHARNITGFGRTEAEAQEDWFRQHADRTFAAAIALQDLADGLPQ